MVSMEEIEALARRIAEQFQPEKIILFGSYAYGNPTPDSDVDLLVIMDFEGHSARKAAEIRYYLNPAFPLDVLVKKPQDAIARAAAGDFFVQDVLEEGKVLADKTLAREAFDICRSIRDAVRLSLGLEP